MGSSFKGGSNNMSPLRRNNNPGILKENDKMAKVGKTP
jgi:hypothetical protein